MKKHEEHKEFESGNKPFTSTAFIAALKNKKEEAHNVAVATKPSNDDNSDKKIEAMKSTSILDVKRPDTSSVPDIKEKVIKIQAAKKSRTEYMKEIAPAMQDWINALLYGYGLDDEEAKADCAEEVTVIERRIQENLYPKDANGQIAMHYAEPARWAYANALVGYAKDRNDIFGVINGNKNRPGLPGLMNLEMLEFAKNSPSRNAITVEVYSRWYRINLVPEQANHLKKMIVEALKRAEVSDKTYQEYAVKPLADAADISIQEIEQKDGLSFWIVPPGIKKDKKNGNSYKLHGGYLLMESNRKVLRILGVAGDFQPIMEEIRKTGIFLPIRSIPIPTEEVRFPDELPEDVVRHLVILHSALHRGWKAYHGEQERGAKIRKFQADCDAERKSVAEQKATVSMAKWMVERKPGIAMLYWGRKPWVLMQKTGDEYYYETYSLWERNTEGQVKCLWYPERLSQLFKYAPTDFVDAGERYEKLRYPYGAMMKNAFAYAKAQEQEKAEQEATRKWVEDQKKAVASTATTS